MLLRTAHSTMTTLPNPQPLAVPPPDDFDEEEAEVVTRPQVLQRIEALVHGLLQQLSEESVPVLPLRPTRSLLHHSRNLTNLLLVLAYCHRLLQTPHKTATIREVYYHYVTHFRHQPECSGAIAEACQRLGVPRHALGLQASPKGWCRGDVQVYKGAELLWDGRSVTLPIQSDWLEGNLRVVSKTARCIVVVEKEGIFQALVQDWDYPCILVTGKGVPDWATRACVSVLHRQLQIPVRGLCDGNPYGIRVLQAYEYTKHGTNEWNVPMEWIGLRSEQMEAWKDVLPEEVFQQMTERDLKRLEETLENEEGWTAGRPHRQEDVQNMLERGYKMELEALHWIRRDFMADWLTRVMLQADTGEGHDPLLELL